MPKKIINKPTIHHTMNKLIMNSLNQVIANSFLWGRACLRFGCHFKHLSCYSIEPVNCSFCEFSCFSSSNILHLRPK